MVRNILLFIFTFIFFNVNAQQVSVKGRVVDDKNNPIPGANIIVKGTTNGVQTNFEGDFSINVETNQVLVFSYIGMVDKEVLYKGQSIGNVVMKESSQVLEEVVVIGYQTVKKKDLTGAVSSYDKKTMKNAVVTGGVGDALVAISGVDVRSSGAPGGEGKVTIRGTATFGNGDPLYVIDGVVSGSANRDFNFNDVESIEVLKDASAAAIYGSRAANGVILVTTKKGSGGAMKIDFSYKSTLQTLPEYDLAGRDKWVEINDMAFKNAGLSVANHFDGNTDWQKEVFKTGMIQDYNISFSGGEKAANYFMSANYQTNSGAVEGASTERLAFRSNTATEKKLGDKMIFRVGENITFSNYSVDELTSTPFIDVIRMLPTMNVYNPNNPGGYEYGSPLRDVTFGTNPVAKENFDHLNNENLRLQGNLFAELQFSDALKYRFNFGFNRSSDKQERLRKDGTWRMNEPIVPTDLFKQQSQSGDYVFDNTIEYNKTFAKHQLGVVGGISFQDFFYEKVWGAKSNVLQNGGDFFLELDPALSNPRTGSYKETQKLFSLFGRVNYAYDEKYLFSFTIRRDESSKFSSVNNVGVFPSIAGAWRVSKEKFFKIDWINDFKVRANYGVLGSSNIGPYDWNSYIVSFPQAIFGDDQHIENGATQVKLSNPDIGWEKLKEFNTGFDLGVLNNRLQIGFDYFIKNTQDVLTPLPILLATGNSGGNPLVNAASIKNSGVDLTATWRDKVGDVNYSVNVNGSYLQNEIQELGYGRTGFETNYTKSKVGGSIGEWYLIKTEGLFRSDTEVQAHKNSEGKLIQPNAKPGDFKYADFNDDGQITDADRQYCGASIPKLKFATILSMDYKGFDVMAQFQSAFGQKYYNEPNFWFSRSDEGNNYRADYAPWTPENPNASDPRAIWGDTRNARRNTDTYLENGNYLRLSQLAFGYSFSKLKVGNDVLNARVFINFQNLLTITSYDGLDPEFLNSNILESGYDYGTYPKAKGFTLGAQISF